MVFGIKDIQFLVSKEGNLVIHDPQKVNVNSVGFEKSLQGIDDIFTTTLTTVLYKVMEKNRTYSLNNLYSLLGKSVTQQELKTFLNNIPFVQKSNNGYFR